MNYHCLIVDDEENIAKTTSEYFNIFNIKTIYATSYHDALDILLKNSVSLILLDINLGNRTGFELCKEIRQTYDLPILFISARNSDDDILTALNIGGDDYITKPYTLNILLAKVKAMLKRCELISQKKNDYSTASYRDEINLYFSSTDFSLTLDPNYRTVKVNNKTIKLKEMEYKILHYMMKNPNKVISKDEFFNEVWEDKFLGDGTLTVHIRYLREKIEKNPNDPQIIKTIWGVGYLFEVI